MMFTALLGNPATPSNHLEGKESLESLALESFLGNVAGTLIGAGSVSIDPDSGWVGLAIALVALTAMEIVLGIDNIVFISIATGKLPKEQQQRARLIGLGLAMGFRVLLLFFLATIVTWTQPLFRIDAFLPSMFQSWIGDSDAINEVSVRDLILFGGGLFLIYQSVREIYHLTEIQHDEEAAASIKRLRSVRY